MSSHASRNCIELTLMLCRTTHRALTATLYCPDPGGGGGGVVVTRARRTRRRRAGTPRARGTRPAAAVFVRATRGTCCTRRAAPRTPRGLARRRPRPASREKRHASQALFFGRCDRTATSFCMPAAVKQSKNFCEGFSQPLGARGKPSGRVSSAALEAISNRSSTLANGTDNGVSTIAGTHPQRYHIQRSVPATLVRVCSITFARSRCGFPPRHLV